MEFREFMRTRNLVDGIVAKIITQSNTEGEIGVVKNTLTTVRTLSKPRTDFFQGNLNYSDDYLEAFFSGSGACGMYTLFTCRLLTEMGFDCRVVQQQVNGVWGGHITLEVDLNRFNDAMPSRWLLVDPLFNCVFLDSQGQALSCMQVKKQWKQLIGDLPDEYDQKYNYQQGFRYTNWDKFGLLTRSLYRIGKFVHLSVDDFSFRAIFIRQHLWNLIFYGIGLIITILIGLKSRLTGK